MKTNIQMLTGGGITTPQGFEASGIAAGIKDSGKLDIAMIVSELPATVAGAFTVNRIAAAPILYGRELLETQATVRAIIINSGNANACTGRRGLADVGHMAEFGAEKLGCKWQEVIVSSTGRIGVPLPMDSIIAGISTAVDNLSRDGGNAAAEAIMTTDTYPKKAACSIEIDGKSVAVGGMAKGAGMIAPKMETAGLHATMLAYITTDAAVELEFLQDCLNSVANKTFNRITVDGDMSTNDTVILLANGAAGNTPLNSEHPEADTFRTAVHEIAEKLAREIILDAEGATKFIEVLVTGAHDARQARKCADAIANSILCKTAWFGEDPNWGRILDAAGYAEVELDPQNISLSYNGTPVVHEGVDAGTPETDLMRIMKSACLHIEIGLGAGSARASVWTCDLSYEYVKINADYHT